MSTVLRLSLPLTLWLASFSAVYGLHGLLCSARFAPPELEPRGRLLLLGAALAAVALQAGLLAALRSRRWPPADPVTGRISVMLALVALVGTIWTLFPALMVPHCL